MDTWTGYLTCSLQWCWQGGRLPPIFRQDFFYEKFDGKYADQRECSQVCKQAR